MFLLRFENTDKLVLGNQRWSVTERWQAGSIMQRYHRGLRVVHREGWLERLFCQLEKEGASYWGRERRDLDWDTK